MKVALIFFGVVAIAQARILPSPIHGRIINGEDAHPGEFPYQVSLQTSSSFHFCGGSILNKKYVITAAHCVVSKIPFGIKVIAATTDLRYPNSTHAVAKIIVHRQYNPYETWRNDIALIKVKNEFVPSSLLNFVTLPFRHQKIPTNSIAVVSGWGSIQEGGSSPHVLQQTTNSIASQDYCKNIYKDQNLQIYSSHICAFDPFNVSGACHGDSGGPLTVNGKLIGVVSFGAGCASKKYPAVYTRVPEYIDWIENHAL